ncbi:hypothetical protein M9H77_20060 [Catharanthus roseus]|uniref:Uncharacterized protein n=1 Tax=Catharanthus roseus TaxID=4058 RepID=A0ACC0AL44_CATRO|nr:hypothetical protein M9H77_20060 [Catharanthus roseus]
MNFQSKLTQVEDQKVARLFSIFLQRAKIHFSIFRIRFHLMVYLLFFFVFFFVMVHFSFAAHTISGNQSLYGDQNIFSKGKSSNYYIGVWYDKVSEQIVAHLSSVAADSISGNQSLSGDQTIVSKGGNFELGFFKPGVKSSNYYIGIRYKKVSKPTIVWVANRITPVSDKYSSHLIIKDGNLVLLNESRVPIWSTNVNSTYSTSLMAILLDDGNFKLINGLENINSTPPIWQSFDNPTDTWLPGGKLSYNKITKRNQILTSWRNSEDPAPGLFSLELLPDEKEYVIWWNHSKQYWTSGAWNGRGFSKVPELGNDNRYNFRYEDNENEIYFTYSTDNIARMVMDVSGQIKTFIWLDSSQQWNMFWKQPKGQCEVYTYCGEFGICNENSLPFCYCLPGFKHKSDEDWNRNDFSGGCVRETRLQCENNSTTTRWRDKFWVLDQMKLPEDSQAVAAGSAAECESACLSSCSCTAYAYQRDGCSIWNKELLNLQQLSAQDGRGRTLNLRLAASEFSTPKDNKGIVIGAVLGSVAVAVVLIGLIWLVIWRRRRRLVGTGKSPEGLLVAFAYKDLQNATKNFSVKLGGGGFGSVFKGTLPDSSVIAVKKLESISQGEKQFRAEVSTIGTIQHVNLVRLRGFCSEGNKKLLVYDYMPKGSLDAHLFQEKDAQALDWKTRYQIALGTARGLAYLHEKCRDCIIHCDIKPENILLDAELCPKVADFGLAKLMGRDFSRVLTTMRGTRGYLAPEWISGVAITEKADVYSYGMMLFEFISGERNLERSTDGVTQFFPSWAAKVVVGGGDILGLLDPRLKRIADEEEVSRLSKIACWCIQDYENNRPSMGQVVQILEGVLDVNLPPLPRSLQLFVDNQEHIVFFTESSSSFNQTSETQSKNSTTSSISKTDTISANQSLSGDQTIVSKGGNFRLGFFKPGKSSKYYIGIWYDKVSEQTVIWVANRVSPVSDKYSSHLKIQDGNLVLLDESNTLIWSTNISSTNSTSLMAILLDDGNFKLIDGLDNIDSIPPIWQSFDNPTDTSLPGIKVAYNKITKTKQVLTSWRNSEDPAPGLFSLELRPNEKQCVIMWNKTKQFWSSGEWNGHTFSSIPEMNHNTKYNFSFVDNENESYLTYSLYNPSTISRFIIDVTGQLKLRTCLDSTKTWYMVLAQPRRQCEVYAYCGAFGICNENLLPFCNCLPGFKRKSVEDWNRNDFSGGCVREIKLQCEHNSSTTGQRDKFWVLDHTRLPGDSQAVAVGSAAECESACLSNCSCTAYAYELNGCLIWNRELLNLQQLSAEDGDGRTLHLRLAASEFSTAKDNKGILIGAVLGSATFAAVLLCLISLVIWRWQRRLHGTGKVVDGSLVAFTYKELQNATKNFSVKLGGGGFGSVFKGTLPDSSVIAVKKLESISQGDKQFRTEVSTIGTLQHINLVRLCGFCADGNKKLLVYEYMPNGSLDAHLFHENDSQVLDWQTRYQIALGTARGLAYLHEKCRNCIIHCDIKPENILLDAEFCPKVADFGLAKLMGHDLSRVLTTMRGTRGYLAPEWISGVAITAKADVYSYGMMLFELISGKRNTEYSIEGVKEFFPAWAAKATVEGGDILNILDPRLNRIADDEEVSRLCKIAIWCIQDDEYNRPFMGQVVQILEGVLDVNLPPLPRSLQLFGNSHETILIVFLQINLFLGIKPLFLKVGTLSLVSLNQKVREHAIVWVANRVNPVSDKYSSHLKIQDGNLVLLDESNTLIWSTNVSSTNSTSLMAVLLDDGNFKLIDGLENINSKTPIWQSFDNPTDTLLPGAKLSYNKITKTKHLLTSWRNSEDPAPGLFSLELLLDKKECIMKWNKSRLYWSSGEWNGRIFSSIPELNRNTIYNFSFVDNENETYLTYILYNPAIITRFVMDVSGQIKQRTWLDSNQPWSMFWAQPRKQCDVYAYCGAFGICNENSLPSCDCLPGFKRYSDEDWNRSDFSGGCVRVTKLQCENNSSSRGQRDKFWVLDQMRLPEDSQAVAVESAGECESACLSSCSCTAYSYESNACSIWNGELLNLQKLSKADGNIGRKLYLRLASSEFSTAKDNKGIVIGAVLGSVAFAVVLIGVIWLVIWRRQRRLVRTGTAAEDSLVSFTYKELQNATKNFSEKLGGGGFGSVYKGTLPDSSVIGVKKLESISQGEKQFRTEVSTIGTIQHVNLIRLRGFCSEGTKKLLVYEYMPNGSLDAHLFHENDSQVLDWRTRYQIALGTARGLAYLHEKCRGCIIHCDIKPENILLDAKFCPKISRLCKIACWCIQDDENNRPSMGQVVQILEGILDVKLPVLPRSLLVFVENQEHIVFFTESSSSSSNQTSQMQSKNSSS